MKKVPKLYTTWTDAEHKRLIEGVDRFGNDFESITKHVHTRNRKQVVEKAKNSLKHKGFLKIKLGK